MGDRPDGSAILELEQGEGCSGDLRDAAGVEADPAQSLEGGLERRVGAFAHAVDTPDDLVVGLLGLDQYAARGLLDRVAKAVAGVLVAEVDRGRDAQLGGEGVQGVDQAVMAGTGGVVLAPRTDRRDPERPAVGGGDDLHVPAMMPVLPGPSQVCARGGRRRRHGR